MKKYFYFFEEGSKINQIICAVLVNLPVFAYGASIGWMSPMSLLLQSKDSPRDVPLTDYEVSWMASVPYLVCIQADYLMAILSDKLGRKFTLFFTSATSFLAWTIKLSSMEVWAFILARALFGITMAGAYVTCPLYTKEISSANVRGTLGTLVILFHTTGNLFSYIIGDILSYRTILWICLMLPTLHLILFIMMPESPSYLIKKGKTDEAIRAMAWLRCRQEDDPQVISEVNQIKKEQMKDEENNGFILKAILQDKILLRAFIIAMVLSLAREVCGSIPVLNFAGEIFYMASEGSGIVLTPNQQAMALGAVQVLGAMLASYPVEKAGRKALFIATALVSGLSMCALASWFVAREYQVFTPAWIPLVTLCLCIFCDALGLQPVSVIVTGEIFSFKYRGSVMAITMSAASVAAFLQTLFFKPLVNAVGGPQVAFYFFGAVCLVTTIYVGIWVPETKQRILEEIYEDLKTKKEKKMEREKALAIEEGKTVA
ncbi:solute carrier family 2, facilitated glucose transporter member 6-like isoform X3 [Spodoptera frugiperda]|uniref:Solute carrier family 2, facilitated glucose transporter member 6-like isoform X3 n=1 Tax=Spodoptera frugiperda TaxID=7108 RepID=A0A9R0EWS5_SPOFR|nr:solute carrier family 2, facilitated glucose transporter member 6-like isoform X3 [Spodoptera frugiperda]